MAEVYLTERFAASVRAGRSLEETVNDIAAVANAETLPLLQGFLPAPGADGLLELEERLFSRAPEFPWTPNWGMT